MNDIPKVNEKRNADKKFCRENKKNSRASEIARLFLYKPKVFVRRDWFGLCENSHNAKAKNKEYNNIVIFSN